MHYSNELPHLSAACAEEVSVAFALFQGHKCPNMLYLTMQTCYRCDFVIAGGQTYPAMQP